MATVEVVATRREKKVAAAWDNLGPDILKWNNIVLDLFSITQKQPHTKESAVTPSVFIFHIQSLALIYQLSALEIPLLNFSSTFRWQCQKCNLGTTALRN